MTDHSKMSMNSNPSTTTIDDNDSLPNNTATDNEERHETAYGDVKFVVCDFICAAYKQTNKQKWHWSRAQSHLKKMWPDHSSNPSCYFVSMPIQLSHFTLLFDLIEKPSIEQ